MGEFKKAVDEFVLARINDPTRKEPSSISDGFTEFQKVFDALEPQLSEEQKKLLREMDGFVGRICGEITEHYYRAGFSDAIRFLESWRNGQWR